MSNGKETYTQVLLSKRREPKGYTYEVVWIPSKFAKANKILVINGVTWKVEETYSSFSKDHVEKWKDLFRTAFPSLS